MNQITTVGIDLAKRGVELRYCTAERPLPPKGTVATQALICVTKRM
jgi:hypothetical protein